MQEQEENLATVPEEPREDGVVHRRCFEMDELFAGEFVPDKTLFIADLSEEPEQSLLFLKAPGFGKTYILSLVAHYFDRAGKSDPSIRERFLGVGGHPAMRISEHAKRDKEHFQEHPVIYLDLGVLTGSSPPELRQQFLELIRQELVAHEELKANRQHRDNVKKIEALLKQDVSRISLFKDGIVDIVQ